MVHLKKIDLGANRIRIMDEQELAGLVQLEELWLGKNKIEEICGLNTVRITQIYRFLWDLQENSFLLSMSILFVGTRLDSHTQALFFFCSSQNSDDWTFNPID